jgi:nucleotide-binding universal stress UspA family protein
MEQYMLPLKNVLWPTDFSEQSLLALKVASEFCQLFEAKLYIIHLIDPIPVMPPFPDASPISGTGQFDISLYQAELLKANEKQMGKIISKQLPSNIRHESTVTFGHADQAIIDCAKNHAVDLIIMAPHSKGRMERFFLGSVAEKVVRLSPIPVMMIPESENNNE